MVKQQLKKNLAVKIFVLGVMLSLNAAAQVNYISTVAGIDTAAYSGDGGPATYAALNAPRGVAVDTAGNIYIADWLNNRIRKVNAVTGVITTVAGTGTPGYTGNGGLATLAQLDNPLGVALDDTGNIYIADAWNHVIRKVQISTGKISTVAGNATGIGTPYGGYSGDGGLATSAKLNSPTGVAVDDSGNIYIADYYNNRIRKVSAGNHFITTIAGNGFGADTTGGYGGDGGPADSAELFKPTGVAVDDSGNVYIDDTQNDRIRVVSAATGIINTVAGNGYGAPTTGGFSGDGGPDTAAKLYYPTGIALDSNRNIYFTDRFNNRVRKVDAATHIISTIAGNGMFGFGGDGGNADSAEFGQPAGIALDKSGNIYVADDQNNRIRKISNTLACTPVVSIPLIEDSVCTGSSGIFTAVVTNGGSKPFYQWKVNGVNAGTDSVSFAYTPVHAGDKISVVITSNAGCAFPEIATSDTLKMGIYAGPVKPLVTISASASSVCSNIPITFSSAVLRGGANPVYLWQLNGNSVGADSSAITLSNLQTGNTVTCILISSLTCASPDSVVSDTIVMTMDSAVTPTLNITASQNPVCAGTIVTFSSIAQNGGIAPVYQWSVNGVVMGASDSLFTDSLVNNKDTVSALLLSSLGCVSTDTAIAQNIVVTVNAKPVTPVISQNGDSLVSTYATGNQWYLNNGALSGVTSQVCIPPHTGNYYTVVTDSNGCISNPSDTINYIIQGIAGLDNDLINLYPNPSNGKITLALNGAGYSGVKIMDALGRGVYAELLNESIQNQNVYLDMGVAVAGLYVLQIKTRSGIILKKFVVQ